MKSLEFVTKAVFKIHVNKHWKREAPLAKIEIEIALLVTCGIRFHKPDL